jgi:CRP/FNR family transcriptional regulator, cyclic AMP receptor protein
MNLAALLKNNPAFARLAPDHLDALSSAFLVTRHPEGHVIARQGERGGEIFLVVEGEVEVSRVHDNTRRTLATLTPGELFGLVSLVDHHPRAATCTARGPVAVASLPESAATLLFRAHAPIACAFQKALAAQLAHDFRRLDAKLRALYEERAKLAPTPAASS